MSDWEPIEIYDQLKKKPAAVFFFKRNNSGGRYHLEATVEKNRYFGSRQCTHFLRLPAYPVESEIGDA